MSETIEIHFSDGTHGRITFEGKGSARRAMVNIDEARSNGYMYTPALPVGEKLHSYNPDQITWVREV